jgi:hypothetical protein
VSAVHAWALAGAALAAGLPVLIHWLTRARGVPFVLPTFRFVQEAATARRRVNRLRDLLVLLLRTLAVLAVGFLFARLLLRAPRTQAAAGEQGRWVVVVLDSSASMSAQAEGATRFSAGQHAARRAFESPGVRRGELILAGQRPRPVFGRLSTNLASLREEAARAAPGSEAFDPVAALAEAAVLLKGLPDAERKAGEVVVVTDLQRSNWASASFAPLPADVPVRVVDVREKAGSPNAAVLRVWASGLAVVGRPVAVTVELANDGASALARDLELEAGAERLRRSFHLPPGQRRQESFVITPAAGGPLLLQARLGGGRDALADDDARAAAIRVREGCRIAIVSVGTVERVGGPAYFLHRALEASEETGFQVEIVSPGRLDSPADPVLARADLIVLADPGRLSRAAADGLARRLLRGTPILFALQSAVDADGVAELEAVLGPACRLPAGYLPLERSAAPRQMAWADPGRRPFRIFGAGLDRFTRDLVLSGGLRTSPRGGDEEGLVLAKLSDGSAALVVVPAQSGRLALLNLPLSGANHAGKSALFVPLVQELALDLVEGPERGGARSALSGRAFSLPLPAARARETPLGSWTVLGADGSPAAGAKLLEERDGPMLVWSPAGAPGAYRVMNGTRMEEAFAVGLPPEESDLGAIDARVLEERIARGRSVRVEGGGGSEEAPADRELWPILAAAALAAFLLELAVLKGFRA